MQSQFSENEIDNIKNIKQKMWSGTQAAIQTLPQNMVTFLFDNAILTGGATASLFHGDLPSDWDLYLKDKHTIALFYTWAQTVGNEKYIEDVNEKYASFGSASGKLITARAVTFKNKIQVITMQTAEQRTQFDMIHCMPWYDIKNDILYISRAQYDSIRDKKIVKNIHTDSLPIKSFRLEKYKSRGWK